MCKATSQLSDWPHGLLAIGTFGSVTKEHTPIKVVQEVIQEEKPSNVHVEGQPQDLSFSGDLEDFIPEEVGKLQKELTKLLTRKNKKSKSDVNRELANLPLDRFLNCPSTLEVDRRISNVFSGGGDSDENQEDIEQGCNPLPNPSLRHTFQESRMEKLLRVMLLKKINTQASSKQTSMKEYVQDKQQLSLNDEEEEKGRISSDGSKWVKTDSDFIVLEI
ncbi:Uncharacterized protein Rs2_04051 [Raphanus sativus]|nr:Uncharacterized protein Rs2_04051 [Raphanus sativus]